MDKKRKLVIALLFLIVISLFVWVPNLKLFSAKKSNAKDFNFDLIVDNELIKSIVANTNIEKNKIQSQYENWNRNPFESQEEDIPVENNLTSEINSKEQLTLQGIFLNEDKSTALINDRLVRVGSKIGIYTIEQIFIDRVRVRYGQKLFELKTDSDGLSIDSN